MIPVHAVSVNRKDSFQYLKYICRLGTIINIPNLKLRDRSMMQKYLSAILIVAWCSFAQSFLVQPQLTKFAPTGSSFQSQPPFVAKRFLAGTRGKSTVLEAKKIDDGVGRGIPILGLVLVVILWTFSIPPEFRRSYICVDACNEYRDAPQCNNCVTGEEWVNGVKEYYQNGGGIQWDFSIDPNSKMKF